MTCLFCQGYCEGSAQWRKNVSIFDGEDYELQQALDRSKRLPANNTASCLRMFFCIEIGQLLVRRECEKIADHCGLEGVLTQPWLKQQMFFTETDLRLLHENICGLLEMFGGVDLEMKMRKEDAASVVSAELFSKSMSEPLTLTLKVYSRFVHRVCNFSFNQRREEAAPYLFALGEQFTTFLSEVGAMPQDYITILNFMHQITSTETISPWSTKIPFL